jgi:DNA-binding CsgD family transcriptional regulator
MMLGNDHPELSERELEILRLVATGASNKEIAQKLFISTNTVKVHLRNIFAKIGAASRTEAALYALHMGIAERAEQAGSLDASQNSPEQLAEASSQPSWRANYPLWVAAALLLALVVVFLVVRPFAGSSSQGSVPAAGPTATPAPNWRSFADMPTPRSGLAVVAYENQLYAVAGKTSEAVTGILERYSPDSDTWEQLSPKPVAVHQVAAAVVGGLVYVPGGLTHSEELTSILEVYDPRLDEWTQRASLPIAVSSYALLAYEGRLYLFGGWDGEKYLDSVFQYDPSLDSWAEMTPMPTRRADMAAVVAGGKIYVLGGINELGALETNEIYQPDREGEAETPWSSAQDMPDARYGMGAASLADIIQVIGGENDSGSDPLPLAYFPQADQWQILEEPVYPRGVYLRVVPLGVNLFSLGGQIDQSPTGQNLAYQFIYTISIPIIVK